MEEYLVCGLLVSLMVFVVYLLRFVILEHLCDQEILGDAYERVGRAVNLWDLGNREGACKELADAMEAADIACRRICGLNGRSLIENRFSEERLFIERLMEYDKRTSAT